ncbi:MAG: cytochrome c oxidase assembly protein [Dehalococcoidia bacterium]|nr:cytochrome c oxidase assembly protein [Dehalococcoidia bacterium]
MAAPRWAARGTPRGARRRRIRSAPGREHAVFEFGGWWPSANGAPWQWGWRAYPGTWLLPLALAAAYAAVLARLASGRVARGEPRAARRRLALFALGLLVLWLAIDWPLGALAGYLLVAHTAQYLLLTLVAAPLLLVGLPAWLAIAWTPRRGPRLWRAAVGRLIWPPVELAVFALVLAATHLPGVLDALRPHAAGAAAMALAWLAAAALFWWPVVGPAPARRRLPYLASIGYLVVPFVLPKVPGAFFIFSGTPPYRVYEQAPRVWALSATADHQLAGLLLWIVGSVMVVVALGVLLFQWAAEDRRLTEEQGIAVPADPRAVAVLFEVPGGWAALERLVAIVGRALSPEPLATELAFALPPPGGTAPLLTLELRIGLEGEPAAALAERIARDYSAFLSGLAVERRMAIADALAFRVVGYGSRVI